MLYSQQKYGKNQHKDETSVIGTMVFRDGIQQFIGNDFVCIGDLLMLRAGQVCTADIVLISANSMVVDNSDVTGSS